MFDSTLEVIEIPLTQGKVAIIDFDDYERVSHYKWYAHKDKATFYAYANTKTECGESVKLKMHRLIMNASILKQVDHINGDGLDNRRSNLRLATQSQNNQNQRKTRGKSRYKGVSLRCDGKKWCAQVKLNAKIHRLGSFNTEEDAARAYDKKARELFGEFARCNFDVSDGIT